MKRQRGELRQNAINAKARLANGYWDEKTRSKQELVRTSTDAGIALTIFSNKIKSQLQHKDEEFEAFYMAVRPLLCCGVSNLHAEIIDHEYIQELKPHDRERYVFEMTRKLQKCVERYNGELMVSNL